MQIDCRNYAYEHGDRQPGHHRLALAVLGIKRNSLSAAPTSVKSVSSAIDLTSVNTIRTLAMDAVQAANSGHPGTPMAMAPVAYTLWQQFLRFDPQDPVWPNRDRFVLSIGHASTLLYALLHLTEVRAVSKDYETLGDPSVPLDALQTFRQLDSRCPGHPEYRWTSGVETTTGPPAKALLPASESPSLGSGWQPDTTALALSCSTSTSTRCAEMDA